MFVLPSKVEKKEYDVAIVGSGPAGLTAAIYSARAGLETIVLEKGVFGGQIVDTEAIENYPGFEIISGKELAERMVRQAKKAGAALKNFAEVQKVEKKEKSFILKTTAGDIKAKAIIVATGERPRLLNVPGEKEFKGKGVSYCATCDANFFKGKEVIVVGGGNSAITEALYLSNIVKKVYVVHRRDKLRAEKVLQERAFAKDNIEFIWNSEIKEIFGKEKVEGVKIWDKVKNEIYEKPIDGVFIYIGMIPNSEVFKEWVKVDERGYIITDEKLKAAEGIFAAGDVRKNTLKQIAVAVGEGAIAAMSAYEYINNL